MVGGEAVKALLVAHPFREVARHFREPHELARFVAHRREHDAGPEARAVLADSPPLVLEESLSGCDLERALGLSGPFVFLRVKRREMLSDDLFRLVALHALGGGVSGDHSPGRIEDERRVLHALDEEPIAFGLLERATQIGDRFFELLSTILGHLR